MKRMFLAMILILMTVSAFAADKGEIYLGPVLGYHFFDNDHGLDDNAEVGLRYGYFFATDLAAELEADYTKTDYDDGSDKNVTSLSLSAVKFFNFNDYYKPFVFVGAGGLLANDDMGSLVAGIGARFIANENLSFDIRVKDMVHSIGARNDVIPSLSVNYHFGSSYKPVKYEETPVMEEKAEPKMEVKEEAKMAEAKVEAKTAEAKVVVKKDSDGDGIFDDADLCADTPAGYPVNSVGCTPDSDKDGVYDFEDRCPNTIAGVKVNSAGCLVSVTLKVNFKTNSAVIDESFFDEVKEFAEFMKANKPLTAEVQGHTDNRGTSDYNMGLSQKRAEAGMKVLTDRYGISKNRLSAVGYGETMPLVPNDTPENMRKNRRIDTVIK